MTADVRGAVDALALARATLRTIKANLFWAFAYNTLGLPLAAGALYPAYGWLLNPMFAGTAMSLSSLSVVLNALRLRHGFALVDYQARTGLPLSTLEPALKEAETRGWLTRDFARVTLTATGYDFLSDVQALFLPDDDASH